MLSQEQLKPVLLSVQQEYHLSEYVRLGRHYWNYDERLKGKTTLLFVIALIESEDNNVCILTPNPESLKRQWVSFCTTYGFRCESKIRYNKLRDNIYCIKAGLESLGCEREVILIDDAYFVDTEMYDLQRARAKKFFAAY